MAINGLVCLAEEEWTNNSIMEKNRVIEEDANYAAYSALSKFWHKNRRRSVILSIRGRGREGEDEENIFC